LPEPLDFALIRRLREVLDRRPATETELRTLKEQAEGCQPRAFRSANHVALAAHFTVGERISHRYSILGQVCGADGVPFGRTSVGHG